MLYAVREGISKKKVGKLETRKKIKSIWPSKDFTTNGIELNLMESAEAEKWKFSISWNFSKMLLDQGNFLLKNSNLIKMKRQQQNKEVKKRPQWFLKLREYWRSIDILLHKEDLSNHSNAQTLKKLTILWGNVYF